MDGGSAHSLYVHKHRKDPYVHPCLCSPPVKKPILKKLMRPSHRWEKNINILKKQDTNMWTELNLLSTGTSNVLL